MLLNSMCILIVGCLIVLAVICGVMISKVNKSTDELNMLEVKNNDNSRITNILLSELKELKEQVNELENNIEILEESFADNIGNIHEEIEVIENTVESILDVNNMQNEQMGLLLEEANSNIDVLSDVTDTSIMELNNELEEVKKQIMILHNIDGEELEELIEEEEECCCCDCQCHQSESNFDKITRLAKKFIDME